MLLITAQIFTWIHLSLAFSIRNLTFGDINFLHTTDTHGWYLGHLNQKIYNANWGDFVLFAHHMKSLAHKNGQDLLIVDSGDRHDGNGLLDITLPNGARSLPIFMKQHYDIVTLGNHELYLAENSQQEVDLVAPHYGEKYVCSNVEYLKNGAWEPISNRYRYFRTEIQQHRVLSFAFLFDFDRSNPQTKVTPISKAIHEPWFDTVLEEHPELEVDLVLVVGHIPVDRRWNELGLLHAKLREYYPNTKIQYFGGHSHIRDFVVYDENSTGLQSGRFCETVGFLSVNMSTNLQDIKSRYFRSYVDFNRNLFVHHSQVDSVENFDTDNGTETAHMIEKARSDLALDTVIGHVKNSSYYMDYVPLTHPKNIFHLLTKRVLPLLVLEYNFTSSERLIIINTGSVRYDLYKGPYTIDTHYIVSPFQNDWVKVTLPKHVAVQIAPILNRDKYIVSMKPPHQRRENFNGENLNWENFNWDSDRIQQIQRAEHWYPGIIAGTKLSKGYVTVDDFGSDGDDTPHRAVVNYPLPNVVQSEELRKTGKNAPVDVVFYSFIQKNVAQAVERLGYDMPKVELYLKQYLGLLLNDFVAVNRV